MACIRALIFDLDGTLIDSLPDICDAADQALAERGFPGQSPAVYRDLIGEGTWRLVERALPEGARDLTDLVAARFREIYGQNLTRKTAPYPGIMDAVTALASRGAPLAVLSNKPHAMTVKVTRALFGANRFLEVHGAKENGEKKPDPTEALAIAARLGIEPSACAFIGDTEVDIETARRASMLPVAVTWGYRDRRHLSGAARIVADPAEIVALFGMTEG